MDLAIHRNPVVIERTLESAIIVAAIATIPLTIFQIRGIGGLATVVTDWLIWAIFFIEYVVLLAVAADRRAYVRRQWLSLAVIVVSFPALPALLALSRLARLARLTRLLRLLRLLLIVPRGAVAIRYVLARRGLLQIAALTAFLVVGAGALMHAIEPATVKGGFGSGVWWAIVTATTVGYGDISPATTAGRIVAGILMLTGIGLVSTIAAAIAAHFVDQDAQATEPSAELAELRERLARIEALLLEQRKQ